MACTLEQLQQVEYEIMCKFADFCDKYSLNYSLQGGTLLGAIRHDSFIPWDDDVDLIMDIKSFKRFLKLIKKNPIDDLFLSWFTTDDQSPLYFAKLRKNNTFMPESELDGIEMHNGVWVDIFVYAGKPDSKLFINLQEKLLGLFQMSGDKYYNRQKKKRGKDDISSSTLYQILDKTPDLIIKVFRRLIFFILSLTNKNNSENLRLFDYNGKHNICVRREFFEPLTKHIFKEREFNVPEKYDELLTLMYGDYMTPVKTHVHTQLDKIDLC